MGPKAYPPCQIQGNESAQREPVPHMQTFIHDKQRIELHLDVHQEPEQPTKQWCKWVIIQQGTPIAAHTDEFQTSCSFKDSSLQQFTQEITTAEWLRTVQLHIDAKQEGEVQSPARPHKEGVDLFTSSSSTGTSPGERRPHNTTSYGFHCYHCSS